LDLAIDRAVREILDVEPPAGLRGRVLRRIESREGAAASAFARRAAWFGLPLAAAAALILLLRSPSPAPPNSTGPVSVARVERPQPASVAPIAVDAPRASRVRPTRLPPRQDRIVVAASYPPAESAGSALAPLESITPIQVAPIAQHRVATEDIAVRPLNPITDVQIAPLTPPDRRN
jgi:hypothetical protein